MNENQSLDPLRNGMGGVRLDRYSTNTFYGLNFTDSVDDVYKTRKLDAKPNIIVNGDNIIFDYSSVKDADDIGEFKSIFTGKKSSSQFTVSNASYSDGVRGINADFSGTYSFLRFIGDAKILATPPTGITYNPDVKVYKSNFFGQSPFIGATLSEANHATSYRITNTLGIDSTESFAGLGILPNDYIKISCGTGGFNNNRLFKVEDLVVERDGTEVITVNKPFAEQDLTGIPVILNTFKTKKRINSEGTICFYASETLLNTVTSTYIESGSLVECKNGFTEYAKILSDRNNYNFIFLQGKTENLVERPYNAASCPRCPVRLNVSETIEQEAERIARGGDRTLRTPPRPPVVSQPKFVPNSENTDLTQRSIGSDYFFENVTVTKKNGNIRVNNTNRVETKPGQRYSFDVSSPTLKDTRLFLTLGAATEKLLLGVNAIGTPGTPNAKIIYTASEGQNQIYVRSESLTNSGPFVVYSQDVGRDLPRGYYYPLFTDPDLAGDGLDNSLQRETGYHEHNLFDYPDVIFYMPNTEKNHGRATYPSDIPLYTDAIRNENERSVFINSFATTSSSELSECVNSTRTYQACYRCVADKNDGSDPCAHAIRIARCYYKYNDGYCDGTRNQKCAPSCADVLQYCGKVTLGDESRCYYRLNQTSDVRDDDRGVSNVY